MAGVQSQKRKLSARSAVREVDQLFSRISRYTKFVSFGKWALLIVALLLIGSLIAWPLLTKDRSGLRVSFVDHKTAKQDPTSPVMNNPEYEGVNDKGQQYKMNGKSATQKTPTLVLIDQVEAQLLKADGSWFLLNSARGEYQQDTKIMDLFGNVTLVDDSDTIFTTERATIETNTSRVYGNEPIMGTGPMGKIVASGFEIKDNGDHIIFTRGEEQLTVTIDRSGKKQ